MVSQALAEGCQPLGEEATEWAVDVALDQTFDFYVTALIKTMWAKPECRDGMLEYAGLKKPDLRVNMKDLKRMPDTIMDLNAEVRACVRGWVGTRRVRIQGAQSSVSLSAALAR